MVAKYSTKITSKMLLTVAPPVYVAKYSTTKREGHRPQTDGTGSSLKLNSVYAVKLKNNTLPKYFCSSSAIDGTTLSSIKNV